MGTVLLVENIKLILKTNMNIVNFQPKGPSPLVEREESHERKFWK